MTDTPPSYMSMRDVLEELAQISWEGGDIDGGTFQDLMVKHGLMVEVEADQEFKDEWDCDMMYVLAWKRP